MNSLRGRQSGQLLQPDHINTATTCKDVIWWSAAPLLAKAKGGSLPTHLFQSGSLWIYFGTLMHPSSCRHSIVLPLTCVCKSIDDAGLLITASCG